MHILFHLRGFTAAVDLNSFSFELFCIWRSSCCFSTFTCEVSYNSLENPGFLSI